MKYNVCSKHMMTHMYVTFVRGSIGFPSEKNTDRLVFSLLRTVVDAKRTGVEHVYFILASGFIMNTYSQCAA